MKIKILKTKFFFYVSVLAIIFLNSLKSSGQTTSDSTLYGTPSEFGLYVSSGMGISAINNTFGLSNHYSFSFAYKSYLFSLTWGEGYNNVIFKDDNERYQYRFNSILIGKALRKKHFLFSASTGLSKYSFNYNNLNSTQGSNFIFYDGFCFPVEIKSYWLATKTFGFGLYYCLNYIGSYSPSTLTLSAVIGFWNKADKMKINKRDY